VREVSHVYEPRFFDGTLAVHATRPSLPGGVGARPRGPRSVPASGDNPERVRGLARENDSADVLARRGYDVEQNPKTPGKKNPDFRIEGRIFDNMAPGAGNLRSVWNHVGRKVARGQTDRIVLNLSDSHITLHDAATQFSSWPIPGLKELIVVHGDHVVHLIAVE
jgi:hypothetical protein